MKRAVFDIFGKLKGEIQDFDSKGLYIVGKPATANEKIERGGVRGGYFFSQKQTLESIDLACASKYRRGIFDEEGQRKTFLNIVNFYRDVMKMKININVSNYILEPWSLDFTWIVWLFDRMFKRWAAMESYDDLIDEYANDLSTYGTTVSKKIAKCPERVPLRTLRNTQTAKSLYAAASSGGYAIIENDFHYNDMEEYPDWDTDGLSPDKSYTVFERYGLVPERLVKKYAGMSIQQICTYKPKENEKMVLALAILIAEGADEKEGVSSRKVLFMEKLDEDTWPLEECHINRQDGRWLGIGEPEKQLENQISRNLDSNLRRRGILWATKKIFQSSDDNVQKNLVMEVSDGEVLHVKRDGNITQVNTASQHSAEITADENSIKENSQQISFAFEVATGESLPSNTPFRLGVILQASVAQHFSQVRETFSNFLKRAFFDQIVPSFREEYEDEHEAIVGLGESDIEAFKEEIIIYHTNMRIWDAVRAGKRVDPALIRAAVEEELARNAYAFINVPEKYYEHAEYYMKLNLTEDISSDIAELTTIWSDLNAKGDPRAEHVLKLIMAKRGKALPAVLGPRMAVPPVQDPNAPPAPVQRPTEAVPV